MTGEFESAFLAGGSSIVNREINDFYRTPAHATLALLELEVFEGVTWEPACGDGAISKLLWGDVISSDLIDRGCGEVGINFLSTFRSVDNVVTNPPYKEAQEFVEHALECSRRKVAMLLKLNFLEGQARHEFFRRTPLKSVYVFSKRLSFDRGDEKGKGNGLLAYAWYVWEKGYVGAPNIGWIR